MGSPEVNAETIERAHQIYPVTAIQTEYSLWERDVEENGVLETCRELGIGFIPYSPIGRGFLTGNITKNTSFDDGDFRKTLPRFQEKIFEANLRLIDVLKEIAKQKNCTLAQLSLAWLLAQGDFVVPIPGTKTLRYLQDNIKSVFVSLIPDELSRLDRVSKEYRAVGERYLSDAMKRLNMQVN